MAKGIEARLKALEKDRDRLAGAVVKLQNSVFGRKDEAPKARKPRKPRERKALGAGARRDPLDPHGIGALPATDPRYADYADARKAKAKETAEGANANKGRARRLEAEPAPAVAEGSGGEG